MGQMILKRDINPLVILLTNLWFCGGALGYYLMGQQKKALISLALFFIAGTLTCGLLVVVWPLIAAYDGYLLAQKLQTGKAIGENENALAFLNNIFKD